MKTRRLTWVVWALCVPVVTAACMLFGPVRAPIRFDPQTLPDAQAGVPYEARIAIRDNATPAIDFSVSEGALPPGLTMEKAEGEDAARIFGTPAQPGTFKFKVYVYCYGTNVSGQQAEQEYSLVVK